MFPKESWLNLVDSPVFISCQKRIRISKTGMEYITTTTNVARRPRKPRTFLEFAIKTSYVLDP